MPIFNCRQAMYESLNPTENKGCGYLSMLKYHLIPVGKGGPGRLHRTDQLCELNT